MKDRFVMMTYTRVLVNLDYYIDTPQETLNGGTLHILQGVLVNVGILSSRIVVSSTHRLNHVQTISQIVTISQSLHASR